MEISFESNAPYYLSYRLDENRRKLYEEESGGKMRIQCMGEELTLPFHTPLLYHFPVEEYSTVIIASDGFSSFSGSAGPLPAADIIGEFTAFKNYAGEFIRRRAKRAVSTYEKQSVINTDDLSLAAIYTFSEKEDP
ncbi:MAG: hypothetical protein V2I97_13785 [Desulfococcaceae bacterium]|nr:hypothetical protein [Desulfococcaceae bacterium]